jgi:hypothetical protein
MLEHGYEKEIFMNRYVRPVMFAFEPDVVNVFALASFGAAGAPTLNTSYSKGLCNLARNSIAFTATTTSSVTVTGVSSFAGLYPGMIVTGTNIPAATTIVSMNAGSGHMTLSQAATGANTGLTAAGGQYTFTFGSQYTPIQRLDSYVRLLDIDYRFDESAIPGSASTLAGSPYAPSMFLVQNNISNSQLANLVVQFGSGVGASFVASDPANGEIVRVWFAFTRSTAI